MTIKDTTKQLLQKEFPCIEVTCFFGGEALTESSCTCEFERQMIREIETNGCGLSLYRTDGLFRNPDFHTIQRRPAWQLKCAALHSEISFTVEKKNGQEVIFVLMLSTQTEFQGNFFVLKDFLLKRVAKTLFSLGYPAIIGEGQPNTRPVRNKRDFRYERTTDGTPKLVRLYELLGFVRLKPRSNYVALTQQGYLRAVKGGRTRFQHGAGVLDGQTVS